MKRQPVKSYQKRSTKPQDRIVMTLKLPVAALRLNEDIRTLERIAQDLDSLDPINITEAPDDGVTILRMMRSMARLCLRYATLKLRHEYLSK